MFARPCFLVLVVMLSLFVTACGINSSTNPIPADSPLVEATPELVEQASKGFKKAGFNYSNDHIDRVSGKTFPVYNIVTPLPITEVGIRALPDVRFAHGLYLRPGVITLTALNHRAGLVHLGIHEQLGGDGVKPLASLPRLASLNLGECKLTPADFKVLREFPALTSLAFDDRNALTDAGAKELAAVDRLVFLRTNASLLSVEAISRIGGMNGLKQLDLVDPSLSDAAVYAIKELSTKLNLALILSNRDNPGYITLQAKNMALLKEKGLLHLSEWAKGSDGSRPKKPIEVVHFKVNCDDATDATLKLLTDFAELADLDLAFQDVADAGMKELRVFSKLNTLSLRGTKIGNAGLAELGQLKSLKALDLTGTRVTKEAVEKFRAANPDCSVAF